MFDYRDLFRWDQFITPSIIKPFYTLVIALIILLAASGRAGAQGQNDESNHLGVARCSGNNCHGAVERPKGSSIAQNEYLIWGRN